MVQDILWASLHYLFEPVFMRWPAKRLRQKALETVMQHIHYEDENTRYICIGPVNKVCTDILMIHIIIIINCSMVLCMGRCRLQNLKLQV